MPWVRDRDCTSAGHSVWRAPEKAAKMLLICGLRCGAGWTRTTDRRIMSPLL
jgi:hypothetical protein